MLRRLVTIGFAAILGMAAAVFYEHAAGLDAQPNTVWLTIAPPPPEPVLLTKLRHPTAVAPNLVPVPHRARQSESIPKPHRVTVPALNPANALEPAPEGQPMQAARTPDQVSAVQIDTNDYDQAVVALPDNSGQVINAPIIVTSLPQPILAPVDIEGEIELKMITGVELEGGISSPSLGEIDEVISDVERHQVMLQEQAGIYGYVAEEADTPRANDSVRQTASHNIHEPGAQTGLVLEPQSIEVDARAVAVETAAPSPVAVRQTAPLPQGIEAARLGNDTALDKSRPNRLAVPDTNIGSYTESNPNPADATDDLTGVKKLALAEPSLDATPPLGTNNPSSIDAKPDPVTQDVAHNSGNGVDAEAEIAARYFAGREGDQNSELAATTETADSKALMVALPVHKPADFKKSERRKRAKARRRAERRRRLAARKPRPVKKPKVVVVEVRSNKLFGSIAFVRKN